MVTGGRHLPVQEPQVVSAPPATPAETGGQPVTPETGLTSEEARRLLAQVGPNEPAPERRTALAVQILLLFANPLVIILLVASLVSGILREFINSIIIITMVLLSVALNFIQNYRSQRAAESLRAVVAPTATALRDGVWSEIPRRELVPGDVVQLSAGDMVPADGRLLQSVDLHVQQAALTGESLPVEKSSSTQSSTAKPGPLNINASDAVFLGTSVVSGSATALVVATGPHTQFGAIAARLAARPPETDFERGTRQFGLFIMRTIFFLVLFVFLVTAALKHDPLESLLFAVALAVGLTPEFLPMITTVTLSRGAVHMSKQKVIVKNLAAIQNFGSIDILCSDKTGTITGGEMALVEHLNPAGGKAEKAFVLAYLNSLCETGIKSPLDQAILSHQRPGVGDYHKLGEIPFDFERRRLSVVVEYNGERLLITKGAPESVLPVCSMQEVGSDRVPLDKTALQQCETTYRNLSTEGYRVLAVAYKPVPPAASYRIEDEQDLVLAGYLAFSDPPLPDAANALQVMKQDGVSVKILTGDNELVTKHVCEQVGLGGGRVVLGDELDHMTDAALGHVVENASVFARVSPAQKNRILLALKSRGHVVGFLGDGINDAPSLHAADVGISVSTGADVAKDAADIILLEPGLRVLHNGILEGRKAFGNVMKYLLMGTSSNFGNMFSMAAASLFLPFLPMLPTQILLNNFLYDLAQVTIPTDNVDPSFILKPHRWDIKIIRDFMVFIGPISSLYDFLTFAALLLVFNAAEELFHTGWFVESLATQTLVLFVIRTAGNPFKSRPSLPLTITVLVVVLVGLALPFTPLAALLGFTPMPAGYFLFLLFATGTYLALVELVKRRLMRRLLGQT